MHTTTYASMIQKIKAVEAINTKRDILDTIFVPGHAGVKSNERAHALAGNATIENGSSMDKSDIINALR
uniref:RNase H type-1 domain-containing protein n=1 Tax=Arion vulgaris TaxID=1028688 RepID=A0A0B7AEV4_9EUPU